MRTEFRANVRRTFQTVRGKKQVLRSAQDDKSVMGRLLPGLKSVRENWVVPPGLRSFFPLFPALKRWAKFVRPSGAGFSNSSFHRIAKTPVLTHTLRPLIEVGELSAAVNRCATQNQARYCATQNQVRHRVFHQPVKPLRNPQG